MCLVPSNAHDVEVSDQFELRGTTKTGIRHYVRALKSEIADAITIGSRDFQFLCGQSGDQCLLVLIRDGRILRGSQSLTGIWRILM
jgi:hypothetical protein